jgi:hypothetical protein
VIRTRDGHCEEIGFPATFRPPGSKKVKAVMTTEQAAKYDELVKKNQVWGGVVTQEVGGDDENK